MNLAKMGSPAGYGALLGALGGLLLVQLGIQPILAVVSEAAIAVTASLIGAALFVVGARRLVLVVDAVLFTAFLTVACTPLVEHLTSGWVRRDPVPRRSDAIVVLSSGVLPDSALSVDGLDRLLFGLELAQAGAAPRLITTRVVNRFHRLAVTSDVDQRRLVSMLRIPGQWDVVGPATSTREEATASAGLLLPGSRAVVVVTSPMHTRRACATFEAVGFLVSCQPAREHEYVTNPPREVASRLAAFRYYLYERLGMLKYRWKHWVRA
jgi:uncharacterized SAM-binding protein YcdF (DUF218 family)